MGTFLLCSIYMFILHVGQAVVSKPASSNYFIVGLCDEKKTPYSTFKLNLVQHWGEHSMSIELLQAAWLPSTTKSAWIRALESLREFSFLSFSPPRPLFSRSLFFFFLNSSSSSWPYQYITVVFKKSLPSATENTQKPKISQQLTSRWRKKHYSGCDCWWNLTLKCCPVVFQFQRHRYEFINWFGDKIKLAAMTNMIKYHADFLLYYFQPLQETWWYQRENTNTKCGTLHQHRYINTERTCIF